MNKHKQNLKNFKSWLRDIKYDTEFRNIKLKNWHNNNMEKMKIFFEKCSKKRKNDNINI